MKFQELMNQIVETPSNKLQEQLSLRAKGLFIESDYLCQSMLDQSARTGKDIEFRFAVNGRGDQLQAIVILGNTWIDRDVFEEYVFRNFSD